MFVIKQYFISRSVGYCRSICDNIIIIIIILLHGKKKFPRVKVYRHCPLVVMVKVGCRKDKALGNQEGSVLNVRVGYELRLLSAISLLLLQI